MDSKLRFISLQSGSSGNCLFVESHGIRLLFDCGMTGTRSRAKLARIGVDVKEINALLVSHAHCDHTKGAGVLHRMFGIPVWLTQGTYDHLQTQKPRVLGNISANLFRAGETLRFDSEHGTILVETLPTTHDAPESVCFIVDNGTSRLGIMTDLGCPFLGLHEAVKTLDGILIESDYDPEMLLNGHYDKALQDRIRSQHGHLSNFEAAELLHTAGSKLRWAVLGHLSENNNTPELALKTARKIIGNRFPVYVAPRQDVSIVLEL